MAVELADLHVFDAVVRCRGVTRAARELKRAQSNVSARIHKLESAVGVALFERQGRGLRLTPTGEALLPYAQRLLALASEARGAVSHRGTGARLRLGFVEGVAGVALPAALLSVRQRFPEVGLELQPGRADMLTEQLIDGRLDAALLPGPGASDTRLHSSCVLREPLVALAPLGSPNLGSSGELRHARLIALADGWPDVYQMQQWIGSTSPEPPMLVRSLYTLMACVAGGAGVAVLPRSMVQSIAGPLLVSVQSLQGIVRPVEALLAWREGPRDEAQRACLATLEEALQAPRPRA